MESSQLQKPNFIEEAQKLLQSLPRHNAWGESLCLYKGFWLDPTDLTPTLRSEQNFQARDTDIVVVTVPKSGTTWLKSLVFAITRRAQHPISDINHPFHTANSHELVPFIEYLYEDIDDPDLSLLPSPRLFSTHDPYSVLPESVKATDCRVIYLCRDPKDTFVSMWHFMHKLALQEEQDENQKIVPLEEAFELFCKGITHYGPSWDHVLGYWNASLREPVKVLFLRYEDLKADILCQVRKIAEFSGFPFSAKEESEGVAEEIVKMCSFESQSKLEVNGKEGKRALAFMENTLFFRKGNVGDWVNYMTPLMAEQLDQIMVQKLEGSDLKFN